MDIFNRINLLYGTQADLATVQEEKMPGIASDKENRLGWFIAGSWKWAALHGTSESFADVTLDNGAANALLRFDATKKLMPGLLRDDGSTCYHPSQFYQWTSERTQSAQYVKTDTTTITGAASTEKSLITGQALAGSNNWTGITIPAGRVNILALLSSLKLKGQVSSSGSTLITWRIKINSSTIAYQSTTRNWGNTSWRIEGDITTRATGATGTRRFEIGLYANADNANSAISYYDLSFDYNFDLTSASTIDVTVEFSSAATSVSCTTAHLRHS